MVIVRERWWSVGRVCELVALQPMQQLGIRVILNACKQSIHQTMALDRTVPYHML